MFKRFMVFEYTTYYNVEPFDCVVASYDDKLMAKAHAERLKDKDDPNYGKSCVFDRVNGCLV
tara:strand:+ start:935 stop:1120 length:186 start_codon:yes stop_codon:yes gene_type:complete